MTVPPSKRSSLARLRAADQAEHEAELDRLRARIEELEATNAALGKAIGLLHTMREPEPEENPPRHDPSSS